MVCTGTPEGIRPCSFSRALTNVLFSAESSDSGWSKCRSVGTCTVSPEPFLYIQCLTPPCPLHAPILFASLRLSYLLHSVIIHKIHQFPHPGKKCKFCVGRRTPFGVKVVVVLPKIQNVFVRVPDQLLQQKKVILYLVWQFYKRFIVSHFGHGVCIEDDEIKTVSRNKFVHFKNWLRIRHALKKISHIPL